MTIDNGQLEDAMEVLFLKTIEVLLETGDIERARKLVRETLALMDSFR
ncbi:hypothetical protein FACS1894217_09380 [Clostridia bacterium]|nr:hypothetical protein FACS1894217_09380 [Clostridia bacterium]